MPFIMQNARAGFYKDYCWLYVITILYLLSKSILIYDYHFTDDASLQRQLVTSRKFKGCMRKVIIKGQNIDFSQVHKYHNIYPNSCPKNKS